MRQATQPQRWRTLEQRAKYVFATTLHRITPLRMKQRVYATVFQPETGGGFCARIIRRGLASIRAPLRRIKRVLWLYTCPAVCDV